MNELARVFCYQGRQVRTVVKGQEPWFVASDVCDVLDITNYRNAVSRLSDKMKGVHTVDTPGGPQEMLVVNEPGVYKLVFTSRKPEAERFTDWIVEEVLPEIRKTGSYIATPADPMQALLLMNQQMGQALHQMIETQQQVAAVSHQVTTLNHRVDSLDATNIDGTPRQRLSAMMRKYAYDHGIIFSQAWKEFDQRFNLAYRRNIGLMRANTAGRLGRPKSKVSRPEVLEAYGMMEDAIRVADKMLNEMG